MITLIPYQYYYNYKDNDKDNDNLVGMVYHDLTTDWVYRIKDITTDILLSVNGAKHPYYLSEDQVVNLGTLSDLKLTYRFVKLEL